MKTEVVEEATVRGYPARAAAELSYRAARAVVVYIAARLTTRAIIAGEEAL